MACGLRLHVSSLRHRTSGEGQPETNPSHPPDTLGFLKADWPLVLPGAPVEKQWLGPDPQEPGSL